MNGNVFVTDTNYKIISIISKIIFMMLLEIYPDVFPISFYQGSYISEVQRE